MKRSFLNRFPETLVSQEEWKEKFLNRINESIFLEIEKKYWYDDYFKELCKILWFKSSNFEKYDYLWVWNKYSWLESLTNRDFFKTLNLLELLGEKYFDKIRTILFLSKSVDGIDLWIRFHNGLFYKAWDEDLDKIIIDKSINNISIYERAKKHYKKALIFYSSWNYSEALTNCYTTIEKLAQSILWNDKNILKNKDDLIKFLKKSDNDSFVKEWREILKNLLNYLQDFSTRHWKEIENIDVIEVDATIYLTWTIINLLSKKDIKWR